MNEGLLSFQLRILRGSPADGRGSLSDGSLITHCQMKVKGIQEEEDDDDDDEEYLM